MPWTFRPGAARGLRADLPAARSTRSPSPACWPSCCSLTERSRCGAAPAPAAAEEHADGRGRRPQPRPGLNIWALAQPLIDAWMRGEPDRAERRGCARPSTTSSHTLPRLPALADNLDRATEELAAGRIGGCTRTPRRSPRSNDLPAPGQQPPGFAALGPGARIASRPWSGWLLRRRLIFAKASPCFAPGLGKTRGGPEQAGHRRATRLPYLDRWT